MVNKMVRIVPSQISRVLHNQEGLYLSSKRRRILWRTSPRRRSAAEDDGSLDVTAVPICGQCTALSKTTGRRCGRRSCLDFRFCMQHLKREARLVIAPSRRLRQLRVRKALGLYAAHPTERLAKDAEGYPSQSSTVVFRRGDTVATYGGELLTKADFELRYDDPRDQDTAAYAISTGDRLIDGLAAASAASYSNEALDIAALMRRARSQAEFKSLYNAAAKKKALVNVRSVSRGKSVALVATKQIQHGSEILWNYSADYWASDSLKRLITGSNW